MSQPDDTHPGRRDTPAGEARGPGIAEDDESSEGRVGGLGDIVRRAVAAGVGAARSSKEEVVRAAAGEIRGWLDHMELDKEIVKALTQMVIEVKTEVRFRPSPEGGGKVVPEVTNEARVTKE